MSFASADVLACRNQGHKFEIVGSDKTPLKRSLMCLTCTLASGNPTYVAYGVDTASWGTWKQQPRAKEEGAS